MVTEAIERLICFLLLLTEVCCIGINIEHHYSQRSLLGMINDKFSEVDRPDLTPRSGEILVQDSILYNEPQHTTSSSKITRRMWPMMKETFSSWMQKIQAGATMIKEMIMPKTNTKKKLKFTIASSNKKIPIKIEPMLESQPLHKPVFMDHETHNGAEHSYSTYMSYEDPNMAQYEAALLELEKKEEKKYEANMNSFHYNKNQINGADLIKGEIYDGWKPVVTNKKSTTKRPVAVSTLHTSVYGSSDVKPVHEEVEEESNEHGHKISRQENIESTVEKPTTISGKRKQNRDTHNIESSERTGYSTSNIKTTEKPNYPAHFFEQSESRTRDKFLPTIQTDLILNTKTQTKAPNIDYGTLNQKRHRTTNKKEFESIETQISTFGGKTGRQFYPRTNTDTTTESIPSGKAQDRGNKNSRGVVKYG